MKTKITFLVLFIAFLLQNNYCYAQKKCKKTTSTVVASKNNTGSVAQDVLLIQEDDNGIKSPCDTPNYYSYNHTWTVVDYSVSAIPQFSSGFVNGVNTYDDKAKANYFANTGGNSYLLGGLIAFSRAYSTNPAKTITVKAWSVSGGNPGTVLASKVISMQQVMTDVNGNFFTNVHFDNPVLISGAPFFLGVDFSNLNWGTSHDTLSIQSNQDPETSPSAVWEYQSDLSWYHYTAVGSWPLNISLAIFPVLSNVLSDAVFTPPSSSVCSGYPVSLDASPSVQNSVHWVLQGATPNTSNLVSPTVTYAAAGTYPIKLYVWGGSCNNIDSMISSITIIASPVPNAVATPSAICYGNSTTLTASNGTFYQWTGYPPSPSPTQSVSPTSNTTYTVTVTGSNGCTATQSVLVTVHQLPNPNAAANPTFVCLGNSTILSATPGMTSYLWNPGGNTNATFLDSPTSTTIYTVNVVDGNTCSNTDTVQVIVDPCTGISENNNSTFSLSPNPSSDFITVYFSEAPTSADNISIYSLDGKLIYIENIEQSNKQYFRKVNITSFSKGLYFVKLMNDKGVAVRKFVKQ